MRVGTIAQSLVERLALAAGRIPEPIIEVFPSLVLARSLMAAARFGLFDALAAGERSAKEVAVAAGLDPRATGALLDTLASAGYLARRGERYRLTRKGRRWVWSGSPHDVSPYLRYNYLQWDWLGDMERYLQSGAPLDIHQRLTPDEWTLYEGGMRVIARLTLPEVVWRARLPPRATALLDVGGGHGLAAANFCARYPHLRATVLDLPEALAGAAPLPAALAGRVALTPGDALTTDLGEAAYDVIYMANLLHHFDAGALPPLAQRVARALRPGGLWIIQDGVREPVSRHDAMSAAIGDLYFGMTSASGFWSFAEMAAWQAGAGLRPRRPIPLLTAPGQGLQIGVKPGGHRRSFPWWG